MTDPRVTDPRIEAGSRVRLHFSLALADGTEAVSTFGQAPLEFTIGDGTLLATLEETLIGMTPGDQRTFLLAPEHAYGARDDTLVHDMPLTDFPDRPEAGQIIGFSLPNGEETAGAVLSVEDDTARVDFNHPLAGRDVVFRVAILDMPPSAEIAR